MGNSKMSLIPSVLSNARYHLCTMLLFTKSDFKILVLPITVLAVSSTPLSSSSNLLHVVIWLWLHALQNALANQIFDSAEDVCNKKDRPIPAGRITQHTTVILRYIVVPVSWVISACYGPEVFYASFALSILTFVYNELGFAAGHWLGRNSVIALSYVAGEIGSCLIAGTNHRSLSPICIRSIICSAGLVASTIQAQDFRDVIGDKLVGRKTLPVVAPTLARWTFLFSLLFWSVALGVIWKLSTAIINSYILLAMLVGYRFVAHNSIGAYSTGLSLYVLWLMIAFTLPAYYRKLYSSV